MVITSPEKDDQMINKNMILKKITAIIIMNVLIFSLSFSVNAEHKDFNAQDLEQIMQDITDWKKKSCGYDRNECMFNADFISSAGSPSTDWYAIAMGRMGVQDNYSSYLSVLKNKVSEKYKTEQKLDSQKATEWHRLSLVILALGGDPTEISESKINLIADGTYNRESSSQLDAQGINGLIWGLISLDSMSYAVPDNAKITRISIITKILERQNPNGSFSLTGNSEDTDITAMTVTALSPYFNSEEKINVKGNEIKIRDAIEKSVTYLSEQQKNNGGFSDKIGSEAISQTIIALCSLGIDPINDSRFIKNDHNLIDGLMSYKHSDGGFLHNLNDQESDSISCEQAFLALISLYRYQNNLRNLYDFRPEMTANQKAEISSLETKINKLKYDKQSVAETFESYLEIKAEERRYVKNYYLLADKMEKLNITNTSESLIVNMNKNVKGSGTVIDIISQNSKDNITVFNGNDILKFNSLPDKVTTEHYTDVLYLLDKLNNANNKKDYPEILSSLNEKKLKIEALRKKIEKINENILNSLYPFDSITLSDKETIEIIYNDIESLSRYDKTQILGYDDVLKAKTKLETMKRNIIIEIVFSVVLIILLALIVLRIRKKRAIKKKNELSENEDW